MLCLSQLNNAKIIRIMAAKRFSMKGKTLLLLGTLAVLNSSICTDKSGTPEGKKERLEKQESTLASQAVESSKSLSRLVGRGVDATGIQKIRSLLAKLQRITDQLLSNLRAHLKLGEDAVGTEEFEPQESRIRAQIGACRQAKNLLRQAESLQLNNQQNLQRLAGISNKLQEHFLSSVDANEDAETEE